MRAPDGRPEHVDQARDFAAVALEGEERLVLEQILGVEVTLPPLGGLRSLRHVMKIQAVIPSASVSDGVCYWSESRSLARSG